MGPCALRRRDADRTRRNRRFRRRLHLQISQRRSRRAGLYLCPTGSCRNVAPGACRLARPRAPFAFERDYRAAPGIDRLRVGTPRSCRWRCSRLRWRSGTTSTSTRCDPDRSRCRSCLSAKSKRAAPRSDSARPRDPAQRGCPVSLGPFNTAMLPCRRCCHICATSSATFARPTIRSGLTPLSLDEGDIHKTIGTERIHWTNKPQNHIHHTNPNKW